MGLQTAMSSTAPITLPAAHLQSLLSSAAASAAAGEMCGRLPGLVLQQLDVCRRNPLAMPCVGLGARLGLVECQYQFQYERWNCSPVAAAAAAAAAVTDGDEAQSNSTSSVDTLIQRGITISALNAFVRIALTLGGWGQPSMNHTGSIDQWWRSGAPLDPSPDPWQWHPCDSCKSGDAVLRGGWGVPLRTHNSI